MAAPAHPLVPRLDSPWAVVALTAALYALFIGLRLHKQHYDPSRFVTAGDEFCDPRQTPPDLTVARDSSGYDGQYYYRLALHPLSPQTVEFGIRLDLPPYRQQRIGCPLIVWAVSLGRAGPVPIAMILVNLAALCGIAWIAGSLARSLDRHALWGMLIACYPGFVLTLARDLTEIVEICFLLAGLLALRRERHLAAELLLTCAVLTKETALAAAVAAGVSVLVARPRTAARPVTRWTVLALPVLACAGWQLFLRARWGVLPLLAGGSNIGPPFVGLAEFVRDVITRSGRGPHDYWLALLIFLAVFTGCVLAALRTTRVGRGEMIAWGLYGLLAISLTRSIWVEHWAFLRALSEFYVLGALVLIASDLRVRPFFVVYAGLAWEEVMRGGR